MRPRTAIGVFAAIVIIIAVFFISKGKLHETDDMARVAASNAPTPMHEVSKNIASGAKPPKQFLFNNDGTVSKEAMACGVITSNQVAAIMAAQARAVRQLVELDVQNADITYDRNTKTLTGVVKLYPKEGQLVTKQLNDELREILGHSVACRFILEDARPGNGIAFDLCYVGLTKKSFSIRAVDGNVNVEAQIVLEMPNPMNAAEVLPITGKSTGKAYNIEDLARFQTSLREIVVRKSDFRF